MMNILAARVHASRWIVPSPFATVRDGRPCVGTSVFPSIDEEIAVTAPTFEEAFELLGRVCPPAYLPVPVEAYAGTPWRRELLAYLARGREGAPAR
jgi:hypothetical protein